MGGFGCIKKGVICENNFRWKDKVEDLVEDLGALRIKEVRVTRRARESTPQYIIACQGADVKGNVVGARGARHAWGK